MDTQDLPVPAHPHTRCNCEPAVAYLRVSKIGSRDDDLLSPELQLHEIAEAAPRDGFKITDVVSDLDKSGRDFTKRRVAQMVEGIKLGKWKSVWLWKWSRWGRDAEQALFYISQVRRAGGKVQAATEKFDMNTSIGKFTVGLFLHMAELYSDQIGETWKETQNKRRREGLTHNGQSRFGYVKEAKGYAVDPVTGPAVAKAYRDVIAGTTIYQIAVEWNARGFRTTRGNPWNWQSVYRYMWSGFPAGLIRERTNPSPEKKAQRPEEFDVWRVGVHEALITEMEWSAFRAKMNRNAEKPKSWVWAATSLADLLVCGLCLANGETVKMIIQNSQEYRKWICPRYRDKRSHPNIQIRHPSAETEVLKWLQETVEGGDDVQARAELLDQAQTAISDIVTIEKDIAKLKARRLKLASDALDDVITPEDAKILRTGIDASIGDLEKQKADAELVATRAETDPLPMFETLLQTWETMEAHDQREALSRLVHHFVVLPGAVKGLPGRLQPVPRWKH